MTVRPAAQAASAITPPAAAGEAAGWPAMAAAAPINLEGTVAVASLVPVRMPQPRVAPTAASVEDPVAEAEAVATPAVSEEARTPETRRAWPAQSAGRTTVPWAEPAASAAAAVPAVP